MKGRDYCTHCDASDVARESEVIPELLQLPHKKTASRLDHNKANTEAAKHPSHIDSPEKDAWLQMYGAVVDRPSKPSCQLAPQPPSDAAAHCPEVSGDGMAAEGADPEPYSPEEQKWDASAQRTHRPSETRELLQAKQSSDAFLVAVQAFCGIPTETCTAALWKCHGDVEKAVAHLMKNGH